MGTDHADSIDFVLQQGDMTDHNVDKEWEVAAAALNTMDKQVPYAFVMGNHDLGKNSNKRDSNSSIDIFLMINTVKREISVVHLKKGKWIMCGILSRLPD